MYTVNMKLWLSDFKKILTWGYVYWFWRETGREKWMWERKISHLPPVCTPTRDRTHYLDMCPDQESNLQPFGYRTKLQPTEPPGQVLDFVSTKISIDSLTTQSTFIQTKALWAKRRWNTGWWSQVADWNSHRWGPCAHAKESRLESVETLSRRILPCPFSSWLSISITVTKMNLRY